MSDEPTIAGAVASQSGVTVCYAKCWPCSFGQCPGGNHRWADADDIEHAESIGKPETAEGICGCPCARGPVLDDPDDDDPDVLDTERVSIGGPPCHLCGAAGACGYDDEGRPYIHATSDEDETETIR